MEPPKASLIAFSDIIEKANEYYDYGEYYLKLFYTNKEELTIICYNMELLDGIKYELKINIEKIYELSNIFRQFTNMGELYELIIDLVNEKSCEIQKKENDLLFNINISDIKRSTHKIQLILKHENNNITKEYINILTNEIKNMRKKFKNNNNNIKEINELKKENQEIKNELKIMKDMLLELKGNKNEDKSSLRSLNDNNSLRSLNDKNSLKISNNKSPLKSSNNKSPLKSSNDKITVLKAPNKNNKTNKFVDSKNNRENNYNDINNSQNMEKSCTICKCILNLKRCLCHKYFCDNCIMNKKAQKCINECFLFNNNLNKLTAIYNISKFPLPKNFEAKIHFTDVYMVRVGITFDPNIINEKSDLNSPEYKIYYILQDMNSFYSYHEKVWAKFYNGKNKLRNGDYLTITLKKGMLRYSVNNEDLGKYYYINKEDLDNNDMYLFIHRRNQYTQCELEYIYEII